MPHKYSIRNPAERFFEKVVFTDTCWLWTSTTTPLGYSRFSFEGKSVYAHRWVYEFCVAYIEDGLTIDHLCRVRHCVNPNHLEVVSQRENIMRSPDQISANNARKTHCKRGHPFSGTNLIIGSNGKGRTKRICRICESIRYRARRAYHV